MSLDPGTVHRFAMLERAVKSFAKTGRFDESLKLVEELLAIAPEDAGLSKLKARLAADLVKQAAQAQKISAATEILALVEAKIPRPTWENRRRRCSRNLGRTCIRC